MSTSFQSQLLRPLHHHRILLLTILILTYLSREVAGETCHQCCVNSLNDYCAGCNCDNNGLAGWVIAMIILSSLLFLCVCTVCVMRLNDFGPYAGTPMIIQDTKGHRFYVRDIDGTVLLTDDLTPVVVTTQWQPVPGVIGAVPIGTQPTHTHPAHPSHITKEPLNPTTPSGSKPASTPVAAGTNASAESKPSEEEKSSQVV